MKKTFQLSLTARQPQEKCENVFNSFFFVNFFKLFDNRQKSQIQLFEAINNFCGFFNNSNIWIFGAKKAKKPFFDSKIQILLKKKSLNILWPEKTDETFFSNFSNNVKNVCLKKKNKNSNSKINFCHKKSTIFFQSSQYSKMIIFEKICQHNFFKQYGKKFFLLVFKNGKLMAHNKVI